MKYFVATSLVAFFMTAVLSCSAQLLSPKTSAYNHQDTLRGSVGTGRSWWNVKKYDLSVAVDIAGKTIQGNNRVTFEVRQPGKNKIMQVDLQEPMTIEKIEYLNEKGRSLPFKREGNAYWVDFGATSFPANGQQVITIYFKGKPRAAVNPPWDGGWIWKSDEKGRSWVSVACQGLGASVWYPCKDYQGDEPDNGASLSVTVPDPLVAVGNGRLKNKTANTNGTTTWQWEVTAPINSYNIIPYIGYYANWTEKYTGEKGDLDCSYWVLDYNLEKAQKQFGRDVKPMLKCFEYWFGPYPFYEDSYKLVEAPHLGMEHQSAVAYGNKYKNGYLGMDLSGSGWGTKWDYIIIHESGHEWFGNNITTDDIADMWVHEGFTDYSEPLFVECQYGKQAGDEYLQGLRRNIQNDTPVIGPYGVNKEGSGDMYAKGANLLHIIRQVIQNDSLFRMILRGLNSDFYHKTVTSAIVEKYISEKAGKDFSKLFDQYLRTTKIPVLEYELKGKKISYRWSNTIAGFDMPVLVSINQKEQWIRPTGEWQALHLADGQDSNTFTINPNFYIISKKED